MHYLLLVGSFLWFAFIAPFHVTVATSIFLVLVTGVVSITARMAAGIAPSLIESAKAVALSFFFLAIALFTLIGFFLGAGATVMGAIMTLLASWLAPVFFFSAYVLGYKFSLGISFSASAIVAVVSTIVSTLLFLAAKNFV